MKEEGKGGEGEDNKGRGEEEETGDGRRGGDRRWGKKNIMRV